MEALEVSEEVALLLFWARWEAHQELPVLQVLLPLQLLQLVHQLQGNQELQGKKQARVPLLKEVLLLQHPLQCPKLEAPLLRIIHLQTCRI